MRTNKTNSPLFGQNVRRLRESRGWTRHHLAALITSSHTSIVQVERGERGVGLLLAKRLADAFGVTVDFLLTPSASADRQAVVTATL